MKKPFRLTIIMLSMLIITACGKVTTTSDAPSSTMTPTVEYTEIAVESSTPLPVLPTYTPSAVSTRTVTGTPSLTPTVSPTVSPTTTPDRGFEIVHTFSDRTVIGWYPEIIVSNPNDFWIFQPSQILHFQEGINDFQISIDELAEYAIGFAISPEKTIWIFDVGKWPQPQSEIRLLQIDIYGTVLTEYILPKSILVDASGSYIEDDPKLWWEADGSLILGGDNYIYQLLDKTGKLDVQRRKGFKIDSYEYNVLNYYGTQDQPAVVSNNEKNISIVSKDDALILTSGSGWGFVGARANGDFYVQVYEYNTENTQVTSQRIAIRKYDVEGNLVKELVLLEKSIPGWDEDIPSWQFPIVIMGGDGQLYAFLPGNKNVDNQLVHLRID